MYSLVARVVVPSSLTLVGGLDRGLRNGTTDDISLKDSQGVDDVGQTQRELASIVASDGPGGAEEAEIAQSEAVEASRGEVPYGTILPSSTLILCTGDEGLPSIQTKVGGGGKGEED
ncbi:hypothetical protein Salat_0149100 [Sesamum alatum]|uniref:Uncharacterized protein n=1 Tax=Sesamum alatum TaxID=300844 RepID=A0AAE1YXB5_9LAMI|nr:hypothetical protein Salat_0149100 [Sesamum alatum]